MTHVGPILKKIRQSKNFTQKDISGEQLTQSTYSKIEASKMTPTIDNFFYILNRLDISYDEFVLLSEKNNLDPKKQIIKAFSRISSTIELDKIVALKRECAQFLRYTEDPVIQDIQLICQSLLFIQEGNDEKACHVAKLVWDRLSKMDCWYSIELRLINNILYVFPMETQMSITHIALEKLHEISADSKEYIILRIAFFLNSGLLLINQNNYSEALDHVEKALKESSAIQRVDLITISLCRKGIILIHLGSVQQGLTLIDKAILINESLGKNQLADKLKAEVKKKIGDIKECGINFDAHLK